MGAVVVEIGKNSHGKNCWYFLVLFGSHRVFFGTVWYFVVFCGTFWFISVEAGEMGKIV